MLLETEFSVKNHLRKILLGIAFLSIVFCSQKARASHAMGADLTYQSMGGNTYEITLTLYRDCFGIFPEDSFPLLSSSSCYSSTIIYLVQDSGTGQEITPNCPTAISTCNGGFYTGIQQYVYRGTITLAGACSDWLFEYDLCCRNAAITTINRPGETSMHVYATLNNLAVANNNSPTFSNLPVPFACIGQRYCYNHGAFDVDGDSLAFSLITPISASGVPVGYRSPFTSNNPLSSNPALSFNPRTGDICITPVAIEVTVMAVLVNEYRNGVLIGSVERDMQLTVINCENQLPALSGINGSNLNLMAACAGSQVCFNIYSSDTDSTQNTSISWDHSIPGATLTTVPGHRETASFCWVTTPDHISSIPYCFTATVLDDNCPVYGNQTYSYCITVLGLGVDAGPNQVIGCNASASLTATATGGSGNYSYLWNNGQTTASIAAGPGTYVVTASDGRCQITDTVQMIPMIAVPVADFSMIYSCTSLSVQFNDRSFINGGSIPNLSWSFGDGFTSTLPNPQHTYASTGNYSVRLIVRSAGGCIDTSVQILRLNSNQPSADFSFTTACANAQVNFTDHSTSPSSIRSWLWRFGDGTTSTFPNPAHRYSISGIIPVTQIITNSFGCVDSITHSIMVYPSPNAQAGLDDSICLGDSRTLVATGGVSYSWHPVELNTSTIVVSPTSSQIYIVEVTDTNQCTSADTVKITIKPPALVFAGSNHAICSGDSVLLLGAGNGSFLWNPGGGTSQQVMVSPTNSTTYTLTVTNSYGCRASDDALVIVNPFPIANAGINQTICEGSQSTLRARGGGTYAWQPGGATTALINISPATTTTYTVIASYSTGCNDTDEVTVFVNPSPFASFPTPVSTCANAAIQFSDQSTSSSGLISWSWNFGNNTNSLLQNPTAVYTTPGNYQISLVVTSDVGCSDTMQNLISIIPSPFALFDFSNVCLFDTVRFVNNSSSGTGEALSYQWSFGDSTTEVLISPNHYYPYSNTYLTTLIATSTSGCVDSVSAFVSVYALPVVNAGLDQSVCSGENVTLAASGGIGYSWSPGGFSISSVTFIPANSQVYSVEVTDVNGCKNNDEVLVTVNENPIADAGSDQTICSGGYATLTASGGQIYSWNPGGAATNQVQVNPTSTITFIVTVTNQYSCESTDNVQVTVHESPVADAGTDQSICFGSQTTLFATGAGSYQWQPSGASTVSITVAPTATTYYELLVTNALGCSDTDDVAVIVSPLPIADFTSPVLGCTGSGYPFSDLSFVSSGNIASWNWSFGNNTFSSLQHPNANYRDSGWYAVHLNVLTNAGCTDSVSSTVQIASSPITSFSSNEVCLGQAVIFNNTSHILSGEPLTYQWKFGDNTLASTIINPTHWYAVYGNYRAVLMATSLRGCIDSTTSTIVVHPIPHPDFTNVSVCSGAPVSFRDQSTIPVDAITRWYWKFGDNSFSEVANPFHTYSSYGDYAVQLKVTSSFGCVDSVTRNQRINPNPLIDFVGEQKCLRDSIRFINRTTISEGLIAQWQWFFGDLTTSYSFSPAHYYQQTGYYNVQLTAYSDHGCRSSMIIPASAIVHPLPDAIFIASATEISEIFPTVSFANQSALINESIWEFGDGTFSNSYSPVHTYPGIGLYEVLLVVIDQNGCRDSSFSSVEVKPALNIFVPNSFSPNGDGINDDFHAYFMNMTKVKTLIFDRWGSKVAEWSDLNGAWDGNTNEKQAPSDVYIYRIDFTDINGKQDVLIGHVSLVR